MTRRFFHLPLSITGRTVLRPAPSAAHYLVAIKADIHEEVREK
jgi:hypothetical protein